MANVVDSYGHVTVTVAAGNSLAVYTQGQATVSQVVGYPNYPSSTNLLGTVINGQTVFGSYSGGATINIDAGGAPVYYEQGTAPTVDRIGEWRVQPSPVAVDTTGAVSAAAILGGIVTSTTAAAVAGTIPTGTVMDASNEFAINDSVDWSVINTGPNTFTVTAASGHTIVGTATVTTGLSGNFRTRKTAANTFVTYRIG